MCLWIIQIHPTKENRKYTNTTYASLELTDWSSIPQFTTNCLAFDIKALVSAIVKQVRKKKKRDVSFIIYLFLIFI